jgi:hypothetical protein
VTRRTPRTRRALARTALLFLLLPALPGVAPGAGAEPPRASADLAWIQAALPPEQQAELAYLAHLGWRFVRDPSVARVEVQPGRPAWRRTLEVAQEAGDLVVRVPAQASLADLRAFGATLPALTDSLASRCAYQQRIHVATWNATHKLGAIAKRGSYAFPQILVVDSPWFVFRPPVPEWEEAGRLHLPSASPARAIESIYARGGIAECYAAQILATFAIQYELYGPEGFDAAFPREDVAIGRSVDVAETPFGKFSGQDGRHPWWSLVIEEGHANEDIFVALSRIGPKAFSGLTGIIRAQDGTDPCNQNFVIVSVTPRAARFLYDHGGLAWIKEQGRLAHEAHARDATCIGPITLSGSAELERILAQPVLREILLYIHPFGVLDLGQAMKREIEQDDKPVEAFVYFHGREDAFYRRYHDAFVQRWLAANAPPAR